MRFETAQDRANERKVMEVFASGHPFKKLGDNDVDFIVPGKCYVEIKARKVAFDVYPTLVISLIKVIKMQERSKYLPTFLVFGFTDCIAYINLVALCGSVKWGGREQRDGAANDMELLLYIPKSELIQMPIN